MKKYENFCAALDNLHQIFDYEEPYQDIILTALSTYYGLCFEQSWKMMKELLGNAGYPESATGSPRTILKTAYEAGIISDEHLWLDALYARNNLAHAYNRGIALDIVRQTKTRFYAMFTELKETIDRDWI